MAPSHSLPFSNSSQQPVHMKQNSQSSQSPLSSTSLQRPYPVNQSFSRPGIVVSSTSSPSLAPQPLSPSQSTFSWADQPQSASKPAYFPTSNSTHAGGILPSASFFRPSRPDQYSRPSSDTSSQGIIPTHAPDPDLFQLAPLTKHPSNSSEGPSGGPESISDDHRQRFTSLKRMKQSREPLLPIGGGRRPLPLVTPARPGASERSGSSLTSMPSRRRMRNSFERVFSLGRGLSLESVKKSAANYPQIPMASDGRPSFEGKLADEEQDIGILPPSPISRYKVSSPPPQSLNDPTTRNSSPAPASFISHPPEIHPPLSSVPVDGVRKYQLHPSRNRFFFGGRLLTGGDSPWAFIASLLLVSAITGVWFSTTCVWWWKNESPAVAAVGAYMSAIVISTMLATAFSDPGILPRGLDPDPPYPATSPSDGGVRAPMPRDLKVRSDVLRVKYCPTCKTYRPPRSSHCKMCDNCVDGCDHHCQWVNNCVGRRNYTTFFALLLSATLTLILVIATSALHLYLLTRKEHISFKHALSTGEGVGSAIAFSLSISVIWPVSALMSYHFRLLLLNVTTIEQIRNQAHKTLVPGPPPPNPFSHGSWRRNLISTLCKPRGESWLDATGEATEDRRQVNPGFR